MGIFSAIKGLAQMARAGDNFRFIARNMGTIYYCLKQTDFGRSLSDKQLIYAAALCDMFSYLQSGHMGFADVRQAVMLGLAGSVGYFTYSIPHALTELPDQWSDLVNVTMQIEAECFELSTGAGGADIARQVVQHKQTIREEVISTVTQGTRSPLYKSIYPNIAIWVQDPYFREEVLSFTTEE